MECNGIPIRRSARLQQESPTNIQSPSPTPFVEVHITYDLSELPDLGPRIETIALSEMDIEYNGLSHIARANTTKLPE